MESLLSPITGDALSEYSERATLGLIEIKRTV